MVKKLEKYMGNKTYMFPNGDIATPEKIETQFPAIKTFMHVIETDEAGEVCYAVMNLNALKSNYSIDMGLGTDESITEIERIINTPPPEPEPTADERMAALAEYQFIIDEAEPTALDRIAAALEYQNIINN